MSLMTTQPFRVLVVDDDAAVRATYRNILQPPASELDGLEALIAGTPEAAGAERLFEVVEAAQGATAAKLQQTALAEGHRFPLAFIDMRMPPGWDGMQTAVALRAQDPSIYIVIATAFSDYDVDALQRALGHDLVLLRKPFNQEEVFQLARTLCQSWQTRQRLAAVTAEMERRVLLRTADLERRHALQAVLVEITTRFIEANAEVEVDDAVNWSLARLGRVMSVDGCALFRLDAAHDVYRLGYEWHALGVRPLPEAMHALARTHIGPAHARFLRGESFSFNRLQAMPAEMAQLRQMLTGQYESVLAVPLDIGGQLAGFFAIGMTSAGVNWEAGLDELLLAVGHTISRVLDAHEANRKLREGEARYQTLVQNIPGMVYRCALDANWTIQFMSDYIETLSGYPLSDFVDNQVRSYASLIHPDDVATVDRTVRAAVARHSPYSLDYRIMHANGETRWVHERGQAAFDADGEVAWLDGVISDSTDRKRLEDTLAATAEFVSKPSGEAFCADLVSLAARTLGLDYVHVARMLPGQQRVKTEAAWLDGKIVANWSYDLANTPCFDVWQQSRRCIESGVQALYPADADLRRMGAEGYVGESVVNSRGERLGLIVGITRARLQLGDMVQSNLRILATRVAAEWGQQETLQALRSERNTTLNILQTAQVMIVALDSTGHITLINRKGCEILGYQEAELIGQDWFATCLPLGAQVEVVRAVFLKALAADLAGSEYYENPVRTRAGDERLIAWHNSSIRDAEGKVIGGLSAGMDITERRLAEARWLASEERFHTLFDAADAMSIQGYLFDGTVVYWNRASEKIYGYSAAEAMGGNLFDLIIPEPMRAAVSAAVCEMFETGRGAPAGRLLLKHKDGSALPVYSSHTVVKSPGQPTVMFCMDIDMRELDRVEAELNVALTKYKTLFDRFPMGITVTDPAGHILESNAAATHLLGVSQAEHHSRGIDGPEWRIVRTDGTPMPVEEFASVRALKEKRRVADVEMGVVKAEGEITWISVTADLLPLEGYGVVVTYGDITARREAEEQIRKLAYFDPLTDLPNRRLLMDRLGQALIASKRSQEYGALLMLDLDYFKQLNDSHGHDVGDQLLVEVARRLSGNVRQEDTVSRLGGDEYVLILEGLGVEEKAAHHQAELVAEKIRLALNQPYALAGGELTYPCSASIGVTLFHSHQESIEALFKQADIALYRAKGAGRNAVRFYTPG